MRAVEADVADWVCREADRQPTTVLPVDELASWEPEPTVTFAGSWAGPRHAAPRRRPRRRILVSSAAVVLLAVVAAGLMFSSADPVPARLFTATRPPATSAASAAPDAVRVVATDYVGRPVNDVAPELTGLGLSVQLRAVPATDRPDGSVVSIDPAGELSLGMTVTVAYTPASPTDHTTGGSTATRSTTPQPGVPQVAATPNTTSQSTSSHQGRGQGRPAPRR